MPFDRFVKVWLPIGVVTVLAVWVLELAAADDEGHGKLGSTAAAWILGAVLIGLPLANALVARGRR